MHVALYHEIETKLVPALQQLRTTFEERNIHLIILLNWTDTSTRCNTYSFRTRNKWLALYARKV